MNTVQTTEYRHAHPVMIITNLSRVLYLLIIPFLRGMVLALLGSGLAAWLRGAWFDILIVLMIMGIAAIRWRLLLYRFDQSGLYIRRGLFFRQEGFIPLANICTMCAERSWLLLLLRAAVLRADTTGGSPRQFDFEIIAHKKDALEAMELRIASCRGADGTPAQAFSDDTGPRLSAPPEHAPPSGNPAFTPPADTLPAAPSCPIPQRDAGAQQNASAMPPDTAAGKQAPPVGSAASDAKEPPSGQAAAAAPAERVFRPHSLYVAALSAFLSNSFAGVLLASAFINRAGTVLGEELEGRVLSTLTQISGWLAFGIPPVAATVGLIILVGWFIGFMGNLLRLTRFRIERSERALTVNFGLLTRRTYSVLVQKINYLDIRQSLLTKLLRLYLVFIQATGYGKGKNEVSALIPSATRKDLAATMTMLLPEIRPHARAVRPQRSAWLRYVFLPLLLLPALPVATYIALRLLPAWGDVIRFFGLMLWVPVLWLLLLKLVDYFTAGLCREGGTLTLRYSRGFVLHTVVVPLNRAAMTVCSRSLLQRLGGGCDIVVYTYSESGRMVRRTHTVKSLPLQEALRELGLPCKERDRSSQAYHFS